MEAFQEAIAAAKEQSLILKGKRTKRQRPQSPIPFSMISPTMNMEEKATDLDSSKDNNNVETHKKDGVNVITSSSSSASWNSNNNPTLINSKEDEEDQDIANCLMLLSQGHSLPQQLKTSPYNHQTNNNRFSSRKFLETSSSSNGTGSKAGYYVYQCKTCDRTFPSFQALGGHRASHKKPKAATTSSFYTNLDVVSTTYNKNRSLVVYGKSSSNNNNNKVHECGICGAEFTSGQALGGHMRRHRGAVAVPLTTVAPSTVANTELSLSPMSFDQVSDSTQDHNLVMPVIKKAKKTVVSLDLDLNLPAASPEDESRFMSFVASKQKHEQEVIKQREEPMSLVLSTPTLVDCHY